MRLYWNERTAGDDLRFHVGSYRRGLGPWITQHIVHDLVARYGIAFRWRGNWRFLGLLVLENQRRVDKADEAELSADTVRNGD